MRTAVTAFALSALLALAFTGCGEPSTPGNEHPAPAPIPSTPAPRVDDQSTPAPGQVHAAPTPADTGASSTHGTPAADPKTAPAETPGAGAPK